MFGAALQTAATALPLFIAGRVVAGLGVGLVSALGRDLSSTIYKKADSSSSTLPVRVCAKMGSWHNRWLLSALHCKSPEFSNLLHSLT